MKKILRVKKKKGITSLYKNYNSEIESKIKNPKFKNNFKDGEEKYKEIAIKEINQELENSSEVLESFFKKNIFTIHSNKDALGGMIKVIKNIHPNWTEKEDSKNWENIRNKYLKNAMDELYIHKKFDKEDEFDEIKRSICPVKDCLFYLFPRDSESLIKNNDFVPKDMHRYIFYNPYKSPENLENENNFIHMTTLRHNNHKFEKEMNGVKLDPEDGKKNFYKNSFSYYSTVAEDKKTNFYLIFEKSDRTGGQGLSKCIHLIKKNGSCLYSFCFNLMEDQNKHSPISISIYEKEDFFSKENYSLEALCIINASINGIADNFSSKTFDENNKKDSNSPFDQNNYNCEEEESVSRNLIFNAFRPYMDRKNLFSKEEIEKIKDALYGLFPKIYTSKGILNFIRYNFIEEKNQQLYQFFFIIMTAMNEALKNSHKKSND